MPRWAIHGFIALYLLVQIALPARYYACGDELDERFAWRMFSPTRVLGCEVELTADGQPVRLRSKYHEVWVKLAERGRPAVLDAMVADHCRSARDLRVKLSCKPPPSMVQRLAFAVCRGIAVDGDSCNAVEPAERVMRWPGFNLCGGRP